MNEERERERKSKLLLVLLFRLKSLRLYNIPADYTNSHGHISSSLLLTHCTWMRHHLACHPCKFSWSHLHPDAYTMHMIMLPSGMPPIQSFLFPVSDILLGCHPCNLHGMSKEIFKSISNTFICMGWHVCTSICKTNTI